jgi:toxin ParE1/3/4
LYKIVWTDEAIAQLEIIGAYIAIDDPVAAAALANRLIALADSLAEFPHRGRVAEENSREMTTVWPFILRYRVDGDTVLILRIRHGARSPDG